MSNPSRRKRNLVFIWIAVALAALSWQPLPAWAAPDPEPVPSPADCLEANVYYGTVPPGGNSAEVLVFVHGYQGLALDWWYFNFGSGFNAMYDLAYNAGYRTAFINTNARLGAAECPATRMPTHSVLEAGGVVATQLELIAAHYGVDQVTVVAHSKGGLDTQMAMAFYGASPRVKNLITLSSPHQGERLADLVWSIPLIRNLLEQYFSLDDGFRSVRVTHMKALRLYVDNLDIHDSTSYFSAAGTGWQGSGGVTEIAGAILQLMEGDNDGIVTVASTNLPYKLPFFVADFSHNEMYQGDDVWPYIYDVLTAAPTSAAIQGPTTMGTGGDYAFTATVNPLSLTMPLTTSWSATGFPTTILTGTRTSSQIYGWDSPGSRAITVTMSNPHGSATTIYPVTVVAPTPFTPPSSVSLTGPTHVRPGEAVTYTATVLPANVTQNVQYTWQVTNQSTVIHNGGPTDIASFTWTGTGPKTVQVIATVSGGSQSANMTTHVGRPPQTVTLSGPPVGASGMNLSFQATLSNADSTYPVTYEWRTADHDTVTHVLSSANDSIVFNYPFKGVQPIAVRAYNAWGGDVDFKTVDIKTGPTTITVTGDLVGAVNTTHFFTAETGPVTVSVPLTYTWVTTGTPALLVNSAGLVDEASFVWSTPGTMAVDVTVANGGGQTAGGTSINILADVPSTAPQSLAIDGVSQGVTGQAYTFVATVTPITATQPITYSWETAGQAPIQQPGGGNDIVAYSWPLAGTYPITVTASNAHGMVTATHQVTLITPIDELIEAWPSVVAVGQAYTFTVAALPVTATIPVTYTWWSPPLPGEVVQVSGLTDSFTTTWTEEGPTALSVKATNGIDTVQTDTKLEVVYPVSGIGVSGPSAGGVGVDYEFTASVLPVTATTPLDYMWDATGQDPVLRSGGITDTVTFNWSSLGPKTITVTANNGLQPVLATFAFDVIGYPPTDVALTGPAQGLIDTDIGFTATVTPPVVTTPLTYTWEATDHAPVVITAGTSNQRNFNWITPGQKTITVTAANAFASVLDTHVIDVVDPLVAPQAVMVAGPTAGIAGMAYTFTATVSPGAATQPITYTWLATDQPILVHVGDLDDTVVYTWTSGGNKTISVTATNAAGEVSDVAAMLVSVPVDGVSLSGPSQGIVEDIYTFTATASPVDASQPITYTWSADGHEPVVRTGGLTDTLSLSWSTEGMYQVMVSIDNGFGQAADSLTITITSGPPPGSPYIYLPAVIRSASQAQSPAPRDRALGQPSLARGKEGLVPL